jgi:signal transduction histidine kinase
MQMVRKLPSETARYAVAMGLVLAAFLIHYSFRSLLGDHLVFLAFLPASLLAAMFGGLAPGLTALALGFVLGDFFFLPPRFEFVPRGPTEFGSLMIYFFTGLLGVALIERLQLVRERLDISESHKQELEREVHERQRVEDALRKSEQGLMLAQEELRTHAHELEHRVADRTASLKESLTALQNVLYHVAHDLRAPLRAMHGLTELLLEDHESHFDGPGKDYAQRIQDSCRKMDDLTSDLLEYGRLGYEKISPAWVDLTAVFERVLKALEVEAKNRDAKICLNGPIPAVVCDSGIIERVTMNLLTNALKFVDKGSSPQVDIWADTTGDIVRVNIRDQGIGIAPEYQEKIFGVFERLHDDETFPGTGIGLAIVKRGIERMGGRVGVQSQGGQGSCFWFELRRAP